MTYTWKKKIIFVNANTSTRVNYVTAHTWHVIGLGILSLQPEGVGGGFVEDDPLAFFGRVLARGGRLEGLGLFVAPGDGRPLGLLFARSAHVRYLVAAWAWCDELELTLVSEKNE